MVIATHHSPAPQGEGSGPQHHWSAFRPAEQSPVHLSGEGHRAGAQLAGWPQGPVGLTQKAGTQGTCEDKEGRGDKWAGTPFKVGKSSTSYKKLYRSTASYCHPGLFHGFELLYTSRYIMFLMIHTMIIHGRSWFPWASLHKHMPSTLRSNIY